MKSYHILFISFYDDNAASFRFRVKKIIPYLESENISVSIIKVFSHFPFFSIFSLLKDLIKFSRLTRIVIFQKSMFVLLARIARFCGAIVFNDLDDGGFQKIDGSWYPKSFELQFKRWIHYMDAIVVSCDEIRKWIINFHPNVYIIPTCVDVQNYKLIQRLNRGKCIIGWAGSIKSELFLKPIESVLALMAQKYNCEIVIFAGNDPGLDPRVKSKFILWNLSLEPSIFNEFDIGIMPLPNNERTRMKAGFKLLQYMAAGLPVVASPIGINKEIVKHGWNGFLANSLDEWEKYLGILANDPELRTSLGNNGRQFVNENYRLEVAGELWKKIFKEVGNIKEHHKI